MGPTYGLYARTGAVQPLTILPSVVGFGLRAYMRNLTDSELTQIELPKWPQMIVTGKAVTTDQACEIIRKTDLFFEIFAGNNQEELDLLSRRLRIPCLSQLVFPRDIFKLYGSRETWRSVWGSLPTSYVQNSWISDNGPPYGWCRPDGKIQYT